jgi:hypothetical protein
MTTWLARVRTRLTYANVTATLALFIALGGTTYAAASLPRHSVGSVQLRAGAVTTSKLHSGAVRSAQIRDRSISLTDISTSARTALRGAQGPAGAPGAPATSDRAAIASSGVMAAGNARGASHVAGNEYTVQFTHDVSGCIYAATLAAVQNGPVVDQPPAGGTISASGAGGANVLVKTFDATGAPVEAPFHLLVAC